MLNFGQQIAVSATTCLCFSDDGVEEIVAQPDGGLQDEIEDDDGDDDDDDDDDEDEEDDEEEERLEEIRLKKPTPGKA
jgi:TATA-binding protein-associated factor Taf7